MAQRISRTTEYIQAHHRKRWWYRVMAALAAIVVFCTVYALILPAITAVNAVYCGYEEEHSSDCYEMESILICRQEETDEHQHDSECYNEEWHLTCEKPIHQHTKQCFSNPKADVESRSTWSQLMSKLTLTEIWSEDVLLVARSQLGYRESEKNYQVLSDGVTTKGYTRYGDWYGNAYGDWCAMFCAFCLNYAGVTDYPTSANCGQWITALSASENEPNRTVYYHRANAYTPKPSDLIFFDWDAAEEGDDAKNVDHVGFVAEVIEATDWHPAQIKTIEGNKGNVVAYHTYDANDPQILGYGELPVNPEQVVEKSVSMRNGIKVTVSARNASLPYPAEDINLTAELVTDGSIEEILISCLAEEGIAYSDIVLIDVCLKHQGMEIEPMGPVTLTFDTGAVIDASAVYHVDEHSESVTDMNADITTDGIATMETDHFSTFALTDASAKRVTATVNAEWNQSMKQFDFITITTSSPDLDNCYYTLSTNDGAGWIISGNTDAWSQKTGKNTAVSIPTTALSNAAVSTELRVHGATSLTDPYKNYGYSTSFTMLDVCEAEKAGFKNWLQNNYVQSFGGTKLPETLPELYQAFYDYYALPTLTVNSTFDNNQLTLTASTDFTGTTPTYTWEYYDAAMGSWVTMQGESSAMLNASNHTELNGGKDVRCSLYDGQTLKATTVIKDVNPLRQLYDNAIAQINTGLNLAHYPVLIGGNTVKDGTPSYSYKTMMVDVSIHGDKYEKYFYWGNLANDSDIPVTDGDSFADYLASEYLSYADPTEGLARAAEIWNRYIYDIYDPLEDSGYKNDKSGKYLLNQNADGSHDYGDATITYVKDSTSTSFHGTQDYLPEIDPLNYDYLENGVDYKNFVSGLDKMATAVAAGDANTERKYLLDITADAQAKATAPVAMVLQIQTSWQMFDLAHANALSGDYVAVGAVANNTELANLYAIKQALLDFVDYMEHTYPGNNLVLGITEVRHDRSQTMLLGTDNNNKPLYVSNNYDVLRESIMDWDTFGNCEHVHYTDDVLKAAVANLSSNLSNWKDADGLDINQDNIRKVAVIIGGPTENSNSTNGYSCLLPWSSFSGLNSVYGIRANEGTPVGGAPVISWIDYSGNNTGTPFADGVGTNFTDKYVATTRQAMLDTLIDIAEREMTSYGIDIINDSKYVEGVTVNDTVTDEFMIDPTVPFVATIYNSAKYGAEAERDKKASECIINWQTGEVKRITYTAGVADEPSEVIQGNRTVVMDEQDNRTTTIIFGDADGTHTLTIVENTPASGGVSTVSYDFDRVYNTKKCNLNFGIVARENYIGSNNVYTNVGTPDAGYKHYILDDDGNYILDPRTGERMCDVYDRRCSDTPQVNVPIRFTTTDGELKKVLLNTEVDLGTDTELNSHIITAAVEDLVDNYDQISGTLQYSWVLSDSTRVPSGSVDIDGGAVQSSFPSLNYDYLANTTGLKECKLEVTFIPDAFRDNQNFKQDGVTNVKVNEEMRPGSVWVEAVSADSTLSYYIRKDWSPEIPVDMTSVDFSLSDGEGGYLQQGISGYTITSNAEEATVFHLTAEGNWQSFITGLPPVKTVNGQTVVLSYQAEERNIPDGYEVSYRSAIQTDEEWQGHLQVTLKPTAKVSKAEANFLHIEFRYGGTSYNRDLPLKLSADISANGTHTVDFVDMVLPLNGNLTLGNIEIVNMFTYNKLNNNGSHDKANYSLLPNSTAQAAPVQTGSVTVPVLVITNSEAGQPLRLMKTNQAGQSLLGAEFVLYAADESGNRSDTPTNGCEHLISDANGDLTPKGNFSLPYGTYYLVETKAPDGYNVPETPVIFAVNANGVLVVEGNARTITQQDGVITVQIQNSAGYELPKTGGAGTTIFALGGLLMMAGAMMCGGALWRRRERRES